MAQNKWMKRYFPPGRSGEGKERENFYPRLVTTRRSQLGQPVEGWPGPSVDDNDDDDDDDDDSLRRHCEIAHVS